MLRSEREEDNCKLFEMADNMAEIKNNDLDLRMSKRLRLHFAVTWSTINQFWPVLIGFDQFDSREKDRV